MGVGFWCSPKGTPWETSKSHSHLVLLLLRHFRDQIGTLFYHVHLNMKHLCNVTLWHQNTTLQNTMSELPMHDPRVGTFAYHDTAIISLCIQELWRKLCWRDFIPHGYAIICLDIGPKFWMKIMRPTLTRPASANYKLIILLITSG